MKLKILSDLHLEGQTFTYHRDDEDILVLAGDIYTRNRLHTFLATLPTDLPVYFVNGNHEFYHGTFEHVKEYHRKLENDYNFKLLDNEQLIIDDVAIFGGTMFTNFELYGTGEAWFARHRAKDGINDFHCIAKLGEHFEPVKWLVADHEREYHKFFNAFQIFLKHTEGMKRLVITHFMPSDQCTPQRFKGNTLNPYFTTNMEPYMGAVDVWVHGHGHDPVDIVVNETRIISNPRGYKNENPLFNPNLVIEI